MGVVTTACKNLMLAATGITHMGLLTAQAAITGVTGVTSTDTFTKTAHGLANGTAVILTSMTGGSALKAGSAGNADEQARIYFVVNTAANTFQLAHVVGGAVVDLGTDVSAVTVTALVEVTGGAPAYARKTVTYAAASEGAINDSANGSPFDVPAGAVVDYVSYHSASTAGTLLGADKVTQETFGAQGQYAVTDSNIDLMAQP